MRLASIAALGLLGGCATDGGGREVRAGQVGVQDGESGAGRGADVQAPLNGAAHSLLEQARGQRRAGDDALAAASIERAIRIDPQHPQPWIDLGWLRLDEGQIDQAESLARKALALAGRDGALLQAANDLLDAARRTR